MPNTCTGKVPISLTGSPTDMMSYMAANHPNDLISDYTFTLPASMLSVVSSPVTAMCAQYDDSGAIIGYLAYMHSYHFFHDQGAMGWSSPGIFNVEEYTYNDFVNSINTVIGQNCGGQIISISTPWTTACLDIQTAVSNCGILPQNAVFECREITRLCSCPSAVINPCADAAIAAGFIPADLTGVPWSPTTPYMTGNYVEYPPMSNNYYALLPPTNFDVANPFIFFPQFTNPSDNDEWTPCQLDPEPIQCPCPPEISFQGGGGAAVNDQGFFNINSNYVPGDTFQMDWYNQGLQILLSHPDLNFVTFIQNQGLSNPVLTFELPDYDYGGGIWTTGSANPPTFVEFTGPCADDPGTSCYIFITQGLSSAGFAIATLGDWLSGLVIPGIAYVQGSPYQGQPFWAAPSGYAYPSWSINPNGQFWAGQSCAILTRHFVCCHELIQGCQDPAATNYQQYADFSCRDINPVDGLADCCIYLGPPQAYECLPKLTKEEFLMNVAQKPETRSDVFIERGKTSVFERTQRLAQTPTIGELELHGYGYYKINEQRF
jgi:hypothetical protein